MKTFSLSAAFVVLAFTAQAQTTTTTTTTESKAPVVSANYLARAEGRFGQLAGSPANIDSLVIGMRTGGEITLIGSGESVTFTSPAKPMGYGNITRALDLAQRQLGASGITDPTPAELRAALVGGSVSGPTGSVTYEGILQMRASGMGWGQIAHAAGVHPALGKPVTAAAAPTASSGVVTAASGSPFSHGNGRALGAAKRPATATGQSAGPSVSTAAGGNSAAVKAGGQGNGKAFGHFK